MKVLKHGIYYNDNRKIKCSCGCEFEYEEHDILTDRTLQYPTFPPQYRRYIVCPECHTTIIL